MKRADIIVGTPPIVLFVVPTCGFAHESSRPALCSSASARSGSTCSAGDHHTVPKDLDMRTARLGLASPCQGDRVIAIPWRSCEGCHSRSSTGRNVIAAQAQAPVVGHSSSQLDAM